MRTPGLWLGEVVLSQPRARINWGAYKKRQVSGPHPKTFSQLGCSQVIRFLLKYFMGGEPLSCSPKCPGSAEPQLPVSWSPSRVTLGSFVTQHL